MNILRDNRLLLPVSKYSLPTNLFLQHNSNNFTQIHMSGIRQTLCAKVLRIQSWHEYLVTVLLWHLHLHLTRLPKVIWEQAMLNTPLVTLERPTFAHEITPSRGQIPKPNYLPHPWTHPTYCPKPHPYPISRFATMHWTDRHRPTGGWREYSITVGHFRSKKSERCRLIIAVLVFVVFSS